MNSAFQRIKSDPNLLIPYALAILSGGVLVSLILWRAMSADAGVPPPVAKNGPTAIVLPTRTPVIVPTPTPEPQLPRPLVAGNPILPAPDVGTAVPNDQQGTGLQSGPTPDVNGADYENRVALSAPDNPDINAQPTALLPTAQVDTGDAAQGGTQPGFPTAEPTQEAGSGTTLAPLPTPDIGTQSGATPAPTPSGSTQPEPESTATPNALPSPDINTPEPTSTPLGGPPPASAQPTETPPQATGPVIPPLEGAIFLADTSEMVSKALNAGDTMPVDFNAAASLTPGTTRVTAQAYLVEDPGDAIFDYKSALRSTGWLLRADTGELGPLVYYKDNLTLVVAGLESDQMAELGEQRGPGLVVALYDPF